MPPKKRKTRSDAGQSRQIVKDLPAVSQLNALLKENTAFLEKAGDAAAATLTTIQDQANVLNENNNYSKDARIQAELTAEVGQASLNFAKSKSKKDKDILDKVTKQANEYKKITGKQLDGVDAITKSSKQLEVQESLLEQISISQEDISEALEDQIPFGKQLSVLFNKKATSAKKIAGGLFIAVAILKQFANRTAVIGQEFGAIGMMNKEFKNDILGASTNAVMLGQDMKEVSAIVKDLTTNFGLSRDEALGLSVEIMDTSMALGLSNEQGTKLIGSLTEIAGLSFESANNFAKQVGLLAQAEGAAPNAVIRDIAESSETIAKFTGMTPDNLAKAAIQANKLGLTLKDIAGSSEGLLDFQSSLNKEIEASILLGRNVNLQKARELSLNNDLEGVAIEITKQVGSEAEFNKMNLLQRKALAGAINMSVEQLAKVVSNQSKIESLGDKISKQKGFEELVGREGLDNLAKIVNDFSTIGANLVNTIGPAISFIAGGIAAFTTSLAKSPNLIRMISGVMAGLAIKSMTTAILGIITTFSGIPFGLGIPIALGVIGGLGALLSANVSSLQQVGDLGINPNGGPIVASAQMGGVFQGKKGDGLSMGPGFGVNGSQGGEQGITKQDFKDAMSQALQPTFAEQRRQNEKLDRLNDSSRKLPSEILDGMVMA